MSFDYRTSRGSQETQVSRAIMCHFLEDRGLALSDAVRMGHHDEQLVAECRREAIAEGITVPPHDEMHTMARAIIRKERVA